MNCISQRASGCRDGMEAENRELLWLLREPGRSFTPFPFWFLNGDLEEGEIRRQLRGFAARGVYGVVLHPRIGLPQSMGYLSEPFFHAVETAVREAERLGMRVILYDEGMYPSGSAGGLVVRANPALASRGLDLVETPHPGDEVLARTEKGVLVCCRTGGTIRGLHFGEDDGEPGAPPSADILNPEAVALFLRLTHDRYYERLAPWFGTTIVAFFTDEPSAVGRNARTPFPWTAGFARLFAEKGGELAELTALFEGGTNDSTRLYERLILEREGEVYYRRLSEWCAAHGIALVGHQHRSDDIELERWFQVPGQDLALRWVAPERAPHQGIDGTMAHCSADAALLLGRRRNASECLGACNRGGNPWQLSGADVKWYLDWLAVRGVNLFIPHAFYYSIEGPRCQERPPDVGPHSIWWGRYEKWARYMARLSALLTDAEPLPRVAVPCRNRDLHPELADALEARQTGYCYVPESVWPSCRIEGGRLRCRGLVFDGVAGDPAFFPELPHFGSAPFDAAVPPDCICSPPQPWLRVRLFRRAGQLCWLLVNEGEEPIRARIAFPGAEHLGAFDLWSGEPFRLARGGESRVELMRRGSLLVFACDAPSFEALPEPVRPVWLDGVSFRLVREDSSRARKIYEAETAASPALAAAPSVRLAVEAEELCELSVNSRDAGASFWQPHVFELAGLLHPGRNALRLAVTGSPANRYGRPVPYGLSVREGESPGEQM